MTKRMASKRIITDGKTIGLADGGTRRGHARARRVHSGKSETPLPGLGHRSDSSVRYVAEHLLVYPSRRVTLEDAVTQQLVIGYSIASSCHLTWTENDTNPFEELRRERSECNGLESSHWSEPLGSGQTLDWKGCYWRFGPSGELLRIGNVIRIMTEVGHRFCARVHGSSQRTMTMTKKRRIWILTRMQRQRIDPDRHKTPEDYQIQEGGPLKPKLTTSIILKMNAW